MIVLEIVIILPLALLHVNLVDHDQLEHVENDEDGVDVHEDVRY